MAIYYLVPDNEKPSWGIGVIYHHVKALVEEGYDACVLHSNSGFKLPWVEIDVPVKYRDNCKAESLTETDLIIVAEVMANDPYLLGCKARKILFIQAGGYIFESLPINKTHKDLGFEQVMVILPHMIEIVEKFINLPVFVVSPFVSNYFFKDSLNPTRKKEIIIYPKFEQIDFSIVRNLILRKVGVNRVKKFMGLDWRLKLLQNLSHKEVSETLQNSSFYISLNLFEALNTTVVEAMASGCIVFCYEGFGPRDFLKNEENAFVFANNEPYKLVEKLYEVLDNYESMKPKLQEMQSSALATARRFTYPTLKNELLHNIRRIT